MANFFKILAIMDLQIMAKKNLWRRSDFYSTVPEEWTGWVFGVQLDSLKKKVYHLTGKNGNLKYLCTCIHHA